MILILLSLTILGTVQAGVNEWTAIGYPAWLRSDVC